jgi:hypothetical protein
MPFEMSPLRASLLISAAALLACSSARDPASQGSGSPDAADSSSSSSGSSDGDSSGGSSVADSGAHPGADSGAHPGADSGGPGADSGAASDAGVEPVDGAVVNGTLDGQPVVATDTLSVVLQYTVQGSAVVHSALDIDLADYANACALALTGKQKASSSDLVIQFDLTNVNHPETPPPVAIGAYPYDVDDWNNTTPDADGNVLQLMAFYDVSDDTCHLPNGTDFAQHGTITIGSITSQAVTGSFDLMFMNGDHLVGTFDSPVCPVPTTTDGGVPTCE